MVVVGSMGEIEAGDVHAGEKELFDHGNGAGSGTQSADDLGFRPVVSGGNSSSSSIVVVIHGGGPSVVRP